MQSDAHRKSAILSIGLSVLCSACSHRIDALWLRVPARRRGDDVERALASVRAAVLRDPARMPAFALVVVAHTIPHTEDAS